MIKFTNHDTTFDTNDVMLYRDRINGIDRDVAVVQFHADSVDAVRRAYEGGGTWYLVNASGEYEHSAYCVMCKIVDNCDGTVCVSMGKRTREEDLEHENARLLFQVLTGEEFTE